MSLKPIIKYPGGKRSELPRILPHIPEFSGRYIEPFVGGGALFFELARRGSIINDFSPQVVRFYKEIASDFDLINDEISELKSRYADMTSNYKNEKLRGSEKVDDPREYLYYRFRDMLNEKIALEYRFATIYLYINKTAYSGVVRTNSNGEFNVPFGRYENLSVENLTREHANLLNASEIYCKDFEEILAMSDENDFIFLDPPYDGVFNKYSSRNAFGKEDHVRLAETFKRLKAKALMVIGGTDFIRELYDGYIFEEYRKEYMVKIKRRVNSSSNHLVIRNY